MLPFLCEIIIVNKKVSFNFESSQKPAQGTFLQPGKKRAAGQYADHISFLI